jgi:hypothetical protein
MRQPMTRWKAALIHFAISAIIATCVLAALVSLWYPLAVFSASGATRLVTLLIGVDVVLGPLLTLIVFKADKPSLRFDLSVIVFLQFVALAYGLYVTWNSRPILLVATGDRIEWVTATRVSREALADAPDPALRSYPIGRPRVVAALVPDDPKLRQEVVDSVMAGRDVEVLPKFYLNYADTVPRLRKYFKPLSALPNWNDGAARARIEARLARAGVAPDDAVWLPLMLKERDIAMLIRSADGAFLGAVDTPAWAE